MAAPRPTLPDPARRAALLALKLRALVRDNAGVAVDEPTGFPQGAAAMGDGRAWVLIEDRPERGLGPALAWGLKQGAAGVEVLVTGAAGLVARRAGYFDVDVRVWSVHDRTLVAAAAEPLAAPALVDERVAALAGVLRDAGAEPVEEHGVLAGEVLGLEIARVVLGDDGAARIEAGVGRHDREAFALLHGDLPPAAALAEVIDVARRHRRPGADPHPLNRLAQERWLRCRLLDEPSLVGAASLQPAPPPVPRPNVKDPSPAVAMGRDPAGADLVVVTSVGVDLDVVPFAADARAALAQPDTRLVVAVPRRDAVRATRDLAARLRYPAEVIEVP